MGRLRLVLLVMGVLVFSGVQRCALFRSLMRPERLPSKILYQDIPYERRGEPVSLPGWSRVGAYRGEPLFISDPSREEGRVYLFLGKEPQERFQPYERLEGL